MLPPNEGDEVKVCKDCGLEFILTKGEADFYKQKALNLPGRCAACRKKRKILRSNEGDDYAGGKR